MLRHRAKVLRVGLASQRGIDLPPGPVVVCGLAGALSSELAPGTVLVPEEVVEADGWRGRCDPLLVGDLAAAARRLGLEPWLGPILCVPFLVAGAARAEWAARGHAAVEMESAALVRAASAGVAVVRVVLDTPDLGLVRSIPRALPYAARAAAVIREHLAHPP